MEKMTIIKGRQRECRGPLQSFTDLPLEKQKIFNTIKTKVEESLGKPTDVYVFGSHHHGYWDDQSDYDILIGEFPGIDLTKILRESLEYKIDILYFHRAIDIFKLQLIP